MSRDPTTVQQALLAEACDDLAKCLVRFEQCLGVLGQAEEHSRQTAASLRQGSQEFRSAIDGTIDRLRKEFAVLMQSATDRAAASVMAQQSQAIERAATAAMRKTITQETARRSRDDWMRACLVGAGVGSVAATLICSAIWGVVSYTLMH